MTSVLTALVVYLIGTECNYPERGGRTTRHHLCAWREGKGDGRSPRNQPSIFYLMVDQPLTHSHKPRGDRCINVTHLRLLVSRLIPCSTMTPCIHAHKALFTSLICARMCSISPLPRKARRRINVKWLRIDQRRYESWNGVVEARDDNSAQSR